MNPDFVSRVTVSFRSRQPDWCKHWDYRNPPGVSALRPISVLRDFGGYRRISGKKRLPKHF